MRDKEKGHVEAEEVFFKGNFSDGISNGCKRQSLSPIDSMRFCLHMVGRCRCFLGQVGGSSKHKAAFEVGVLVYNVLMFCKEG